MTARSNNKFIAFLRGINVGGSKIIPMKALANEFEKCGMKNVKTILASGNVLFETNETSVTGLAKQLEVAVKNKFGFEVFVQVKRFEKIRRLVEKNPYKQYASDKNVHLYVTFFDELKNSMPDTVCNNFTLLAIKDGMLFSILYRQKGRSTDFMAFIDKAFGKNVTTRNWNTLVKISTISTNR